MNLKAIFASACMLAACMAAQAEAPSGDIVLGKTYSVQMYQGFTATITAPATGTLIQDGGDVFSYIDTSDYDEYITSTNLGQSDNGGSMWSIPVTQGHKYTVSSEFPLIRFNVSWSMLGGGSAVAIDLERVVPKAGSTVTTTVNDTGDILLTFSSPVSYQTATVSANGHEFSCENYNFSASRTQAVRIGDAMRQLYKAGAITIDGGMPFDVKITGIQSIDGTLYNGDGKLDLQYIAGPKAVEMTKASFPEGYHLKSYYTKGSPDGILTITFDGTIATNPDLMPTASLGIGNPEVEGKYVYEEFPATVSGNTVTVDFTGKNRRPEIAAAGGVDGDLWAFKLFNLYDPQGQPIQGNAIGNFGSISFSYVYSEVPQRIITSEFIPAAGASLQGVTEIEIWHDNADVIESMSGIRFRYSDGTSELIPTAQLRNESLEPGEALYHIAVPKRAQNEAVTVELADIVASDGYDKIIEASYNQFVVTFSSPFFHGMSTRTIEADPWFALPDPVRTPDMTDEQWQQVMLDYFDKKLVHIRTNYSEQYPDLYMTYAVRNETINDYIYGSYFTHQTDDEYVAAWMSVDYPLVAGHRYSFTVYAWENESIAASDMGFYKKIIGQYSCTFFGAGEGFVYSSTKFESISPDPLMGTITPDQRTLVVTYDGIVKINEERSGVAIGMGVGTVPFESITPLNLDPENDGFASQWQFVIPEDMMQGEGVDVFIAAVDVYGIVVEGDMATYDDTDYKQFSYVIDNPNALRALYTSPADGETVQELTSITITADYPIGINWNCTEPIEIYSMTGLVAAIDRDNDIAILGWQTGVDEFDQPIYDENSFYAVITLPQPIAAEGTYMLQIPEAYFEVGSQFDVKNSRATTAMITVGNVAAYDLSVTPMDFETLTEISEIYIWTSAALNQDCADPVRLESDASREMFYNLEEWTPAFGISPITSYDDETVIIGYQLTCTNNPAYTADGTYYLTIPAGFFTNAQGEANPEMVYTWFIGQGETPELGTFDVNIEAEQNHDNAITAIVLSAACGLAPAYIDAPMLIEVSENGTDWTSLVDIIADDFSPWSMTGYFVDDNTIRISFAQPVNRLNYSLRVDIPKGYFRDAMWTAECNATTVTFDKIEDGVSSVTTDASGRYVVYSLSGIKVLDTADRADLRTLRGIYIINGRKALLR